MNLKLVLRLLGIVSLLIGGFMVFSLPWAHPALGVRNEPSIAHPNTFESTGFQGLVISIIICLSVGVVLILCGRKASGRLFRKEAMAVVGLSWVLATVLGALPFYFSACGRGPAVRLDDESGHATVLREHAAFLVPWDLAGPLDPAQVTVVRELLEAGYHGLDVAQLNAEFPGAFELLTELIQEEPWNHGMEVDVERARIRYVRMSFVDTLFESQSGFSTTGATVIEELEVPELVPHCILFWRSTTHFLGGLGIIVLFVVILGQGSAGKALMRAELPGPTQDTSQARMQHAAWRFAAIYCFLNLILTCILWGFGMTLFDAICHAFGTMATGGFSTYNASLGHFQSIRVDFVVILFMILAGTNFALIYCVATGKPGRMLADIEWRTYIAIIIIVTALVMWFGLAYEDFTEWFDSLRYGLFQVVSIITTTGYGTHDFDSWAHMPRGLLLLLMFVGGCAGSTGGGMKVIRHVLFFKILRLELEQAFHPTVVRPLRIGGEVQEDTDLRKNILVYFCLVAIIFCFSWLFVLTVEPDTTWGVDADHKLIDSASAVAATLNNIGPGLGIVGATENYCDFTASSKIIFTWLMMLGRVEVFVILCLFLPRFWRSS